MANYIGFQKRPDSCLLKYRVDFKSKESEDLETWIKKALFSRLQGKIPPFLFDGSMCYLPSRLTDGQTKFTVEFEGRGSLKDKVVDIEFRLINELHPTDNDYVHVSMIKF